MAQVLRLETPAPYSTLYDFLTGDLKVRLDTWQTTQLDAATWQESFTLVGRAADAALITAVNSISDAAETCRLWWAEKTRLTSVWLEASSTGENIKRGLCLDIKLVQMPSSVFTPLLGKKAALYQCVITRGVWEDRAALTAVSASTTTVGGYATFAAQTLGDIAGRVNAIQIDPVSGSFQKLWVGIQPTGYSGVSNFIPRWECEEGTKYSSTEVSDSSYSNGKAVAFSTTTSNEAFLTITMEQVTGIAPNYTCMIGRYLALLRCKLTSASDVAVGIRELTESAAYSSARHGTTLPTNTAYIAADHTSFNFLDLGTVQAPPFSFRTNANGLASGLKNYGFELFVQRIGTDTADFIADCLVLVPSERFAYADGFTVDTSGNSKFTGYVYEDGEAAGFVYDSTAFSIDSNANYQPNPRLEFPTDGGAWVIAAQFGKASDIEDTVTLLIETVNRYRVHSYTTT